MRGFATSVAGACPHDPAGVNEPSVQIVPGVLSKEHVYMIVKISSHIAISDFVRWVKGRSIHRVEKGFPDFAEAVFGGGTFSTTSDNFTDDVYFSNFVTSNLPALAIVIQFGAKKGRATWNF
jgi:hypothetical protein